MSELIESLGYLGAFLGSFMEGEILFLTAIQMAQLGYMHFPGVLLAVFLGTWTADWVFYWAGRSQGKRFIQRFPRLARKFQEMDQRLEKYDGLLLFVYRFMYGFRVVLPVLFGTRGIPPLRFGIYSGVACLIWVSLYGTIGYFFAELAMQQLEAYQDYAWIVLLVIVAVVIFFALKPIRRKRS